MDTILRIGKLINKEKDKDRRFGNLVKLCNYVNGK